MTNIDENNRAVKKKHEHMQVPHSSNINLIR